jgi:AraC-like DNA-binding protein
MHALELVQSYFDAWNHSDAKGVAEHLDKNGTYIDIPVHKEHNRKDLIANLTDFFASKNHRYDLIGEVLSSKTVIAFEYKMTPTDSDGEEWFGAEFMTLKGDGVAKITDYYDPMNFDKAPINRSDVNQPKYAKSGLNAEQLEKYRDRLLELMEEKQIYLEPDLTMPKLADLVNCSVNHLSQAVNSGFGMSFFDFLNSYRIQAAKGMLEGNDPRTQAILDVSFAVGFNSNSAFYSAFKKATGQTPAQFRRSFIEKP